MNTSALVLAAGLSRRMPGCQKLLLPLGQSTVIAHTIDNLLAARVKEVVVVLGHEAARVRQALSGRALKFVHNPDFASGMSTSVRAGLAALDPEAEAVLIALADQPLVRAAEMDRLIDALGRAPHASIAVPAHAGQRGNPVVLRLCHKAEMLRLQGDAGCRFLIRRHPTEVLEVAMAQDHVLRDVDTPEAYADLLQRLALPAPATAEQAGLEPGLRATNEA